MADPDVAVITPGSCADPSHNDLCQRLALARSQMAAAHDRARELLQRAERTLTKNRILRQMINEAIGDRRATAAQLDLLQRSEYAGQGRRCTALSSRSAVAVSVVA